MVPGDEGAALGQALRRAGGPEQASSGAAESKSAQEAHRKQMCLQLQAQHKAAHMRLQARLLKLPRQGQPGIVCTIGMPPPKPPPPMLRLPSQGQPRNVCTTGMPPPKPLPPPRPVTTMAALPAPGKAAQVAAAARTGKLLQPKLAPGHGPSPPAWRMSSAQRGASGQQGVQYAARQGLPQPSATAHVQLASSANAAGAKALKWGQQSGQGAQGHAQRQVSNSGPTWSRPQAGAGQPSREHAASAAPPQPACSQPEGSQHLSAAATAPALASQRPSLGKLGPTCRPPSLERYPQDPGTGSAAQRAGTGVLKQQPGIAGSQQERASMRLMNKRKHSCSPQQRPPVIGLPWRPNISNTSATEGAQSASATAQLPVESLKRLASNPSSQAEGSSSQRSMPAGTVGQASSYSRRVPVIPVGSDVQSSEALLSPRKRRIVDWREAQPSAVLPADFQGSAHQAASKPEEAARAVQTASRRFSAAQDKSLRPERYPVPLELVFIDLPVDQQQGDHSRQSAGMPASQACAPSAAQKPAHSKPGQPKAASLTALARAPGTLQEPSKIGVRMPGDPPRQFQRSVQAALCHERLKSKAAAAAACRKPSARVQQTHLRDPTPIRDSLRKQAAPKRSPSAALLLDAPAAGAAPSGSPAAAVDAGGVSRRGRQLKQVVRVDYPLPNTGLRYSKQEPGKGDKWWSKQLGAQSTSPEKPSPSGAQLGKAASGPHDRTPSRALSRTLSKTLSRASSGAGEKAKAKAKSVSPQGSKQPVLGLNAMAPAKHAQRSRPPQPQPAATCPAVSEGRRAPCLAPAPAPPSPEAEAARLGVPVALARSLMQACLPIEAAVQPQQANPAASPNTVRAQPFTADSKWSWSMAQPCAWEWRQQNAAEAAEHLKTPKPAGRPAQLSGSLPDQAAACSSQARQQEPGTQQERASAGSADACGWKRGAPAQRTQQVGAELGQTAGLNAAQMIRTMAGRCVSAGKGALAGLVTRPPSMRVSKRLKFSGPEASAAQDSGGLHSPACASALAAFTAQLAKPSQVQGQQQPRAAAAAAEAAASCGGVSVEVCKVLVSSTAGSSQQQAGQGSAPAQGQAGGSDPARSPTAPGRAKRLCSAHRPGKRATPSPSPRKESLRPRRESVVQGLPLKYALAMAISQARDVGSGRRTAIVKQFRSMAFRIAHVLRNPQDDDEAPGLNLQRQPGPAPDQLSPNAVPLRRSAPAPAVPVHASGTEPSSLAASTARERAAAPARASVAETTPEYAQPSGAVPELDHGGQAKARFLRGQKVNYNLHKLTQRAWKGTGGQLTPDMDLPAEDDYTGSLFRVQAHCSMRPTAAGKEAQQPGNGCLPYNMRKPWRRVVSASLGTVAANFSMSTFCGAVAACVPEPPHLAHARTAADDAAKTGLRNPGGQCLFELTLEGVCNAMELGALPSPPADVHEAQDPMQQQAWSSKAARDTRAADAAPSSAVRGNDSSMLPAQSRAWAPPSPSAVAAAGASRAAAAVLRAAAGAPGAAQRSAPAARPARVFASDAFACPAPPGSLEFSKSKGPYRLVAPILDRHLLSLVHSDSALLREHCVRASKPAFPTQLEEGPMSQSRTLSSSVAPPMQHESSQPKKVSVLGTETGSPALLGNAQAKSVRILGREPGSPTDLGGTQTKVGLQLSSEPRSSAQSEEAQPRKRRRVRVKVVGPQSPQLPAQCPAAGQPSASPQVCPPAWTAAVSQEGAAQRPAPVCANACTDAGPAAQPDVAAEQSGEGPCARATAELAACPRYLGVPPQAQATVSPQDTVATVKDGMGIGNQRQSPACETARAAGGAENSLAGRGQQQRKEQAGPPKQLPSGLGGSKLPSKKLACPPRPTHGRDSPEVIRKGAQVAQRAEAGAGAAQGHHADTEICNIIDLTDELAPSPASEKDKQEAVSVVLTTGLPQCHVRSDPRASSAPRIHPCDMANEHPSSRARLPGLPVKLKAGQPRTLGSPQGSCLRLCSQASDVGLVSPASPIAVCRTYT